MRYFAKRLRDKLDADNRAKTLVALEGVSHWLTGEVIPILGHRLEEAVARGEDRVNFVHTYVNGYRLDVDDLEECLAYQDFKARCADLGLEQLPLSHKLLGERDPEVYPCLELIVRLPTRREKDD
jgi:hypothetical protein